MTPIEEMRANAKAEKAAKKARSQLLHELMEHAISRMPEFCKQIGLEVPYV